MRLISLEHGKWAYRADFALYACAIVILAVALAVATPRAEAAQAALLVLGGVAAWSLIEYLLHRFVLHGVRPFSDWHAQHHKRPTALIYTPTVISATLIFVLMFLPALALGNLWIGCALTLGLVGGDFLYAITHHATHHWHTENAWVRRRQRSHAVHHSTATRAGNDGVTSGLWDRVFGSANG